MAQIPSAPRKPHTTHAQATHPRATSVPQAGSYRPRRRTGLGPQIGFAAAILLGCIGWTAARATLSPDAVVPAMCTLVLAMAGVFWLVARRQKWTDANNVNYLDVAGALALIGICAAVTIDPEQMVRLVQDVD